jgi:hypothetical protein
MPKFGRFFVAVLFMAVAVSLVNQATHMFYGPSDSYTVYNWYRMWTVYDAVYVPLLVLCGLLYWQRSIWFPIVGTITTTWFLADGVFDVMSAHGKDVAHAHSDLIGGYATGLVIFVFVIIEQRKRRSN